MEHKTKMNTKNLMVFFLAIMLVLGSVPLTNAYKKDLVSRVATEINGIDETGAEDISVTAGEVLTIGVVFESLRDASDVKIKAELEGTKKDTYSMSKSFVVEEGKRYRKTLKITVPYELKDDLSGDVTLNIKIWNGDYKTDLNEIILNVQRPIYNADVMSINTASTITAGETLSGEVVIKNTGYNKLDDLYLTVKIPELNLESTSYLGDVVPRECYDEEEERCKESKRDTSTKKFYLRIPSNTNPGTYNIQAEVKNSDLVMSGVKKIVVENEFSSGNIVASEIDKFFAVGETVEYNLLVVNPTNKLKVYRIVPESSGNLLVTADKNMVAVPAGSSKVIKMNVKASKEGQHVFSVNIFSGNEVSGKVTLNASVNEGQFLTNSIVIFTIILAVIFLVLLAVLIVLIGKKPQDEDLEESYY